MEADPRSTGPHNFQMEGWISCAPFDRLLHMKIVAASGGQATLSMPFYIGFAQGMGLMHGGALTSLAGTAVVMAIKSVLAPGTHFAAISSASKFLSPVKQGAVTARGAITKLEGEVLWGQAFVYNDAHKPVMEFWATFKVPKDANIKGTTFPSSA